MMGFSVVLFVCLFGLEPMDTQHGGERRSERMKDVKPRWWCPVAGGAGGRGVGCMTHRPPLEVTRDLPRSYQAKLLNKYTQAPRSGQQREITVSDPSTDVISDGTQLIHVNSTWTFELCIAVHSKGSISSLYVQRCSIQGMISVVQQIRHNDRISDTL